MTEEVNFCIDEAKESMQKAINHLENDMTKLRAGKANPSMLEGIYVDYYGVNSQISQVANISTSDARTIVVQPWEKSMLGPIEKAIMAANLGINPQNDGTLIRLMIPPLTEERRKDLVKKLKDLGEHARVGIRSARREANEEIKKLGKDGLPEDAVKDGEAKVQEVTNQYIAKVDKLLEAKEKEIMTV